MYRTEPAGLDSSSFGIRGIAYHLGDMTPIEEISHLAEDVSLVEYYQSRGYKHFAKTRESIAEQAIATARKSLEKSTLQATEIDAVVIGTSELRDFHSFPEQLSTSILKALGINNVLVVGVTMAGCANFSSSLRVARNLIVVDGCRNVLVIETNQVRGNLERLDGAPFSKGAPSIFSDGAVSCVASAKAGEFSVIGMAQVTSYFTGDDPTGAALMAKNLAACRHVVERALVQANVTREQIHCTLFNNLDLMIILGMRRALCFDKSQFYLSNIQRFGHAWSADTLINLDDYCAEKSPPSGSLFILISNGSAYYSAVVCRKA